MSGIVVDQSQWPVLLVTLPPVASDDEVAEYLNQLRAARERKQPYAIVIDASRSRGFSAKQRQMQADHIAAGRHWSTYYLAGLAFVATSAMQRGMLTAIFWLHPPEWPHRVFSTPVAAKEWAQRQVEALSVARGRGQVEP